MGLKTERLRIKWNRLRVIVSTRERMGITSLKQGE